jgi:two-component system, chemotaxis family, chemotaxis protein CheY
MSPTPKKHVLLVGHCTPDSSFLNITISKAVPGTQITRVNDEAKLQSLLKSGDVHLMLVNRVLEPGIDDEDGIALIKRLKSSHPAVPSMLVSNFQESQQQAQAAGALPGFGKNDLTGPKVKQRLDAALST